MGEVAYTVRAGYEGFEGGALAVRDGTYHLGEELEKGGGCVVVDEGDTHLRLRLDEQPALRPCTVDEARAAAERGRKRLDDMNLGELKAHALALTPPLDLDKIKGTGADGRVVKDDYIAAIRAAENGS